MGGLEEFISAAKQADFDEEPVSLTDFLYSEDFLNLPPLSDYQFKLVEAMTQIYKYESLVDLWGDKEADRLWDSTFKEIIFQLGKGSGKDYCTAIAFTRIAYLLLCLKDPAAYYGKPPGDSIHLLNVAVNAKQAKEVFFKQFKTRVKRCPWFAGKFHDTADAIEFDKGVTAHSGHSEREAWEGYNLLVVVLDEIAAFATEAETSGDNRVRSNTAEAIYNMYKASVSSRFPKYGKLALLSFPRFKDDFIQTRYNEAIAEKHTIVKSHNFKLRDDVPDGVEENEFDIEWEHDEVISYREPYVFALRRPTWDINPLIEIEDFKMDFWRNPEDALSRFACMPPDAIDAFFKDKVKIDNAFPVHRPGPFDDNWRISEDFQPDEDAEYYVHVDLGHTHDRAAVALAHVTEWVVMNYGGNWKHHSPVVKVDAVRYWTPRSDKNVDFDDIQEFILSLVRRGFRIRLVSFDRWNSVGFRQRLKKDYGIETEMLSVAKPHYEDLSLAINEERLVGYDLDLARKELVALRIIRGNRVDHPRKGSKDVSDAIAGAAYQAIKNTARETTKEVEVRYLGAPSEERNEIDPDVDIKLTKPKMPEDLREYLDSMQLL